MTQDALDAVRDPRRLEALRETGLLDSEVEEEFDRLTRLASKLLGVPATFFSLVDEDRDFYKSCFGFDEPLATERQITGVTFCHYSLVSEGALVIPDTRADPVYRNVPTVESLGVAAYLGVPVHAAGGEVLGSFCAIDFQPHDWSPLDVETMKELAKSAEREVALRHWVRSQDQLVQRERRSREQISSILESITDAFFALDREWRFAYMNHGTREAVRQILGKDPQSAMGQSFWEVVPQFRGTRFEAEYRRAMDTQQAAHFEEYSPDLGVWFEVHAYPGPEGLSVYFRDVSERKRVEAERDRALAEALEARRAAEESERMFRTLANSIPQLAWMADGTGSIIWYNQRVYEFTGSTLEELMGWGWQKAHHPDFVKPVTERLRHAFQTGEPWEDTFPLRSRTGEYRWFLSRAVPMRDSEGRIARWFGTNTDITAQREAEAERERLMESERQARTEAERRALEEAALRRATEAVTATFTVEEVIRQIAESAIVATNADGAFVERIHPDLEEVRVVAVAGERTPPLDSRVPYPGSLTERVMEQGGPELVPRLGSTDHPLPGDLYGPCGECSALVIPLLDAGEAIGALFLLRKPEKRGFQPDELTRAYTFGNLASLAFRKVHLLQESESKREELERVMESRARLIRGFSHDVKNPLGAADGFLALLEDEIFGPLATKQRESIGRVRRSIGTALGLINDLVEIARAEAGQLEIRREPVDVREVVREMTEEYRAQAEAKGLEVQCDRPETFPMIQSDPTRIRQILGNLVSNAVKYTPDGQVSVEMGIRSGLGAPGRGDWVVVDVSDTGPGIPEDKRHLLFREFSRLDPAAAPGAGLGLAISHRIAHALGGTISVRSEFGRGSTFTLWLPLAGGPVEAEATLPG